MTAEGARHDQNTAIYARRTTTQVITVSRATSQSVQECLAEILLSVHVLLVTQSTAYKDSVLLRGAQGSVSPLITKKPVREIHTDTVGRTTLIAVSMDATE